jgi:hypothetical protein
MTARVFLTTLALALAFTVSLAAQPPAPQPPAQPPAQPLAAQPPTPTDEFNPYKTAKVGDSATYKFTVKTGAINLEGDSTQTVTAKTEKDLTLKVVMNLKGGLEQTQSQTIDLSRPYDPTKAVPNLPGSEVMVQKTGSGAEKVKAGSRSYDANWTSYKITGKAMGAPVESQSKVWTSKDVPLGVVKVEMTVSSSKPPTEITIELADAPAKKP